MCGLFGVIHFNNEQIDLRKAESAAKALSHRGPDDYGTFLSSSGNAFFCHYRLSIIELSKLGHQPMTTSDGRFTIVYNGEIYNHKEIQKSKVKSQKFKSCSDTEVLIKFYAEEKENCLKHLRGMFAFAVWDDKEKSLFAARDRFGIKPFYYLINNNEFIFSSEIKAIKKYKNSLTISSEAVDAYLRTGSIPAPLTYYNEVNSLLPGEFVKVDLNGELTTKKWWTFNDVLNSTDRFFNYNSSACEEIEEVLVDSVKAHCVSDVEVGAFLSGGIDSASIVSLMKQAGQRKIRTISVTFPGSKLDEAGYARMAAEKYGVEHTEYPLTENEVLSDIDKFFETIDQPTLDGLNTYFVSKAAANLGLKVVMSGLGGDELFGGYSTFRYIPLLELIRKIPLTGTAMKMAVPFVKNKIPAKVIDYLKKSSRNGASYRLFRGLFVDDELNHLLPSSKASNHSYLNSSMNINGLTPLQTVSCLETSNYMANQLLRDSDVFSMCHSIELRVPFVDDMLYKVVLKYLDKGYNKNSPKKILTDAVKDLPSEIVNRRKMGFTFPVDEWLRTGKIGTLVMENILDNKRFNSDFVEKIISDFKDRKVHWSRLWSLYILTRLM